MTISELKKMDIITSHGIFSPIYTCESYDIETETYKGFEIIKTAEEFYQEWLENKDKQIDISSEATTEERITKLEEEKSILAENVYQLASILEIMLGGTEDGQTEATTTDTAN